MDEARLHEWVGAWPGVESSIKWENNRVFSVAGKMFCAIRIGGPRPGSLSFKVEDERFLELTGRPGFAPAPYLARAHWVCLEKPAKVPATELRALLRRSYELVRARLPAKTRRELADEA